MHKTGAVLRPAHPTDLVQIQGSDSPHQKTTPPTGTPWAADLSLTMVCRVAVPRFQRISEIRGSVSIVSALRFLGKRSGSQVPTHDFLSVRITVCLAPASLIKIEADTDPIPLHSLAL